MAVTAAELVAPAQTAPPPARVGQATVVEQSRAVAEVQAAVTVAQRCPRDMVRAFAEMRATCRRMAVAAKAFYSVPNRGSGPSVHLARELARIWGNFDHGVRELCRDDERGQSEILAHAWDQQFNSRASRSFMVPHARMKRVDGKQTRESLIDLTDIYSNNQNFGARAVRECIFSILPSDFVGEAIDICRETLEKGDGEPLDKRIATVIERFREIGVTQAQIEARLERKKGQWTPADLADLHVVFTSIRRGEVRAVDEFPAAPTTGAELLAEADPPAKGSRRPAKKTQSTAEPELPAADGEWPAVAEVPDGQE